MPVGVHPFRQACMYSSWASPNHCDFLFHFSNSSYATALDVANFRFAIATFPNFLRCGGWALLTGVGLILLYTHSSRTVPIKATHYHFIRKIPMSSRFEMRVRIGAWDDNVPIPTPLTNGATTPLTHGEPTVIVQPPLACAAQTPEADGAMLYTVAVSHLRDKLGRRTFPDTSSELAKRTAKAPPSDEPTLAPHWVHAVALRASLPALRREDRWWEVFASCEHDTECLAFYVACGRPMTSSLATVDGAGEAVAAMEVHDRRHAGLEHSSEAVRKSQATFTSVHNGAIESPADIPEQIADIRVACTCAYNGAVVSPADIPEVLELA
ncbi:hypothetical protein DFH09DRAFT_1416024 [Mycena vulgaris]|nr:hypothetical protein DFH09DRAFT_1416024 [Mycena vulgaris]